ncbi:hypothetical protein BJ322DRAFT_1160971 [Thelephora terrestris]|uniref:Ubinuclein middle domain-containing protein n=1 Tax=Thelephora terrestris TaxID=56493 RepID=A0A9P6L4Z1_9AGAM|nr:hypothetical protein BJ322DRAFT_1160971 [Thelephora terrestris]
MDDGECRANGSDGTGRRNKDCPPSTSLSAKPKSSRHARSPSPSPPPPPTRPPLRTIRLEIKLGGPNNYEVNLSSLTKETDQRPPTPEPVKRDSSDSEGEAEGGDEGKPQPKKRRRRNAAMEYYDTSDPFIDDSELPMDERTFFAQTKQQGFYVSSGEVALLKDKSTRKPKSKKVNLLSPAGVLATVGSTGAAKDLSNGAEEDDKKRKSAEDHSEAVKKRRTDVHPFHPELEQMVESLKAAIANESWVKGKFPPGLKPMLAQVALKAVVLGEYDENFFNLMPKIFPYNRYTLSKLIKRLIWKDHINILTERQNELLSELAELTKDGFSKAQEEWEKNLAIWEKRQEKLKAENTEAGSVSGDAAANGSFAAPHAGDETAASGAEDTAPKANAKEAHPPAKKYRLTEPMKSIIWQLVCLSNECCRIENERNTLEGTGQSVSEQGVRKSLYQKIVQAFPQGWISSGQISREVSSMKKKLEKESMEDGD